MMFPPNKGYYFPSKNPEKNNTTEDKRNQSAAI